LSSSRSMLRFSFGIGRLAVVSGLALAASVPWLLASCATTEDGAAPPTDDPSKLPEAGISDSGDAQVPVDGGCNAADPACVTKPISCDEAAWCPVPANVTNFALTAVWGSSKDDVWASGSGGTVIHWDGATWTPTPVPTETALPIKNTFHALWGSGPNDVWVASATDVIFHSDGFRDGSATWVRAPQASDPGFRPAPLYAAWGTNADDVHLGGVPTYFETPGGSDNSNHVVKKPSDAGIEWEKKLGTATIHGIWGSSADDIWLIADNSLYVPHEIGQTLHGTRAGKDFVWTPVESRAAVVLRGIWGSSANDVWLVGDSGTIRHFGPNATEWAAIPSPTFETLHSVWGSGPNDVWAVGETGTILHWDGTSWRSSVAAFPVNKKKPHLYGVWGSGPNDVWIVGDGGALRYTGGAK
jgi:hypothetical protein